MDTKKEAQDLYFYYYQIVADNYKPEDLAKELAVKNIDDKIELLNKISKPEYTSFITKQAVFLNGGLEQEAEVYDGYEFIDYLERVKQEILSL